MSTSPILDTRQRNPNSRGKAPPPPPPRVSSSIEASPHKRTSEYYPQNSQAPLAQPPARHPLPLLPKRAEKPDRLPTQHSRISISGSSYPESNASLGCPHDLSPSAAVDYPHASYKLQPTPHALDQSEEMMPTRPYYIDVKPFAGRPKTITRGLIPASSSTRTSLQQSPTRIDTDDASEELTIFPQQMDIPKIPKELAPKFGEYNRPNSATYQQPHSPEVRVHFPESQLPKSRGLFLPQPPSASTKPQYDSLHHKRQAEIEVDSPQNDTSDSTEDSDDSSIGIGDYSGLSFNSVLFDRVTNITSRLHPPRTSTESPTTQKTPPKSSPSLLEDPSALDEQNLNPYAKPGPPDPYVGSSIVVGLTKSTFRDFIKDLSAAFVLFYNPCDPNCKWAKVNMRKAALVTQRDNHVFAAVDCTKECQLCKKQRVVAFPTMKLFARGKDVATFTDDTILSSRQMTDFVENAPELSVSKGHECTLQ